MSLAAPIRLWLIDITLEDGTFFERVYATRTPEDAMDKAMLDYPTWVSVGARVGE